MRKEAPDSEGFAGWLFGPWKAVGWEVRRAAPRTQFTGGGYHISFGSKEFLYLVFAEAVGLSQAPVLRDALVRAWAGAWDLAALDEEQRALFAKPAPFPRTFRPAVVFLTRRLRASRMRELVGIARDLEEWLLGLRAGDGAGQGGAGELERSRSILIFVDLQGRMEVDGQLAADLPGPRGPSPYRAVAGTRRVRAGAFTDLGQWMLKVLLGQELGEPWLARRGAPLRTASDLAEAASVSVATASRWVNEMKSLGFLERSPEGLSVPDPLAVLKEWWQAVRRASTDEIPAVRSLPAGELRKDLDERLAGLRVAGVRACYGLHEACRRWGISVVQGAPVHLYLEDPVSNLEKLGLSVAGPGAAPEVFVRKPAFPEAVFRAAQDKEGVAASDLLQCWVDLRDHPVRGREQADVVLRKLGLDSASLG